MLNGAMEKKVILTLCGLRDNCPTAHSIKTARHRMFNILDTFNENRTPETYKI